MRRAALATGALVTGPAALCLHSWQAAAAQPLQSLADTEGQPIAKTHTWCMKRQERERKRLHNPPTELKEWERLRFLNLLWNQLALMGLFESHQAQPAIPQPHSLILFTTNVYSNSCWGWPGDNKWRGNTMRHCSPEHLSSKDVLCILFVPLTLILYLSNNIEWMSSENVWIPETQNHHIKPSQPTDPLRSQHCPSLNKSSGAYKQCADPPFSYILHYCLAPVDYLWMCAPPLFLKPDQPTKKPNRLRLVRCPKYDNC